jgi:hypothetical protein
LLDGGAALEISAEVLIEVVSAVARAAGVQYSRGVLQDITFR